MPTNDTAKTKSAPNWLHIFDGKLIASVVLVVLLAIVVWTGTHQRSYRLLRVHGVSYRLEVADTDRLRAQGLGDRQSLPLNQGMLFVFDRPQKTCFWMKDMHFALDIMWTDTSGKVVYIVPYLSPASYPHAFCTPTPAQYVIELNAGQARARRITVGTRLSF